jgi:hypothetical protein
MKECPSTFAAPQAIDADLLPGFGQRMLGGGFIFSVSEDFVANCRIPMLLMPGDDPVHPAETGAEILRLAPNAEVLSPWKDLEIRDKSMRAVRDFLARHTPENE